MVPVGMPFAQEVLASKMLMVLGRPLKATILLEDRLSA